MAIKQRRQQIKMQQTSFPPFLVVSSCVRRQWGRFIASRYILNNGAGEIKRMFAVSIFHSANGRIPSRLIRMHLRNLKIIFRSEVHEPLAQLPRRGRPL